MISLTLALTGDVMLGRLVAEAIKQYGPDYPLGDIKPLLKEADLTFLNLECVIAQTGRPWLPKVFHFRAPPQAIETLKDAGVDVLALANNHVLDFHQEALLEMLERLRKVKIAYTGAGENSRQAQTPAVLLKKGMKVALISVTDNEPDREAKVNKPGIFYCPLDPNSEHFNIIKSIIQKTKPEVDTLIVSAHVGPHMRVTPDREFREFAQAILYAGADIYWGSSNHVFQGIERAGRKVILYDTGDFVDDYMVDPQLRNDRSFLFLLELTKAGVGQVELIPTKIDKMQVNLAKGADASWTIERMKKLCQDLGTDSEVRKDRLIISAKSSLKSKI